MLYRLRFARTMLVGIIIAMMVTGLTNFTPSPVLAASTITGTAFRDFNANGVFNTSGATVEVGQGGVIVTAYDAANTPQGTATTAANGTYTLTATGTGPYRVEFTLPTDGSLSYLEPGAYGTSNNSSVQFVPDGGATNINFGLSDPELFCQDNPNLCTTVYRNGDPLAGGNAGAQRSLMKFSYYAAGNGIFTSPIMAATSQTGALWGEAFQRSTKRLFSAAFVKTHVGMGPLGIGGIYVSNTVNNTTGNFINVSSLGINVGSVASNAARGLPADLGAFNNDPSTFDQVGKVGIGGLAMDDNTNTLYLINLVDKRPYGIKIGTSGTPTAADVTQFATPAASCVGGAFRPFGVKVYRGALYMTGVCDAQGSGNPGNLEAIVYKYNVNTPAAAPTQIIRFPLNYPKGESFGGCPGISGWYAWRSDEPPICNFDPVLGIVYRINPTPMFSGLEFDLDGSMIMGFMDRNGHQYAQLNYGPSGNTPNWVSSGGDTLRAYNNNGTYVLESNGKAGPNTSTGVGNGQGPGGGEFYNYDIYNGHEETSVGGLAFRAGSGQIATTAFDPFNTTDTTGGVNWFSNTNGVARTGLYLYHGSQYAFPGLQEDYGTMGKANGVGDLEILCDSAPIEIGNRVWSDLNKNGIQDANEAGLNGITVQLWADTNGDGSVDAQVGTTTTTKGGQYYFGGLSNINLTTGKVLTPKTAYEVRIDTTQPVLKNTTLSPGNVNNVPTDAQDVNDLRDSDAVLNSTTAVVALTTGDAGANNHTYDFGFIPPPALGSIGNYIWHDEDSDGHQDPGEPGLPNVRVVLKDADGNVLAETRTDAHGGYLFPNLPEGNYFIDVDETTLPPGLTQTPLTNPGSDFGNQDQSGKGYPVTLTPGQNNTTADFGYNKDITPTKDKPGTIGDRVWVDTDGDGVQDPNEPGVTGATLTLTNPGPDGIFGTADDLPPVTTTTDANGNYLFDNLPPGPYKVCVTSSTGASHDVLAADQYTQTGSPDQFGKPANGTGTNCTSVPVVLGPGDVFLNADFGYQPKPTVPLGSIGDTIFFDADGDGHGPSLAPVDGGAPVTQGAPGTADPIDYGIPGVTVVLVRDANGDGVYTVGTDPIIATSTTNAQGQYLFPSLPLGNYLVLVTDTAHVLTNLEPSFDPDNVTTSNVSAAVIDAATPNLRTVDFGYMPRGQTPGLGTIGDTVWFDQDKSGGSTQGNEPGIPDVAVELLDDSGLILKTTTTDANGHYNFSNLPLNQIYQVRIAASNFTSSGTLAGMTGTYDPNTPFDNLGPKITLTAAAPINLDQDFSYASSGPTGSIGNQVWLDTNADGVYQPTSGETPLAGVTIDLYRDLNGNGLIDTNEPRLATTTTASDGTYLFTGLPAGNYVVDVSDRAGLLVGYWHSRGMDGSDNNSQADPYPVALASGATNLTADFGYYVQSAAVGNRVWRDINKDGIQNDGETGINGVPVTLTITYPGGTVSKLVTTTSNEPVAGTPGWYSFSNLLQDEDYNGIGVDLEPYFTISVATPSGLQPTLADQGSNDTRDSDPSGVVAQPIKGQTNTLRSNDASPIASYDFGFVQLPPPGSIGNYIWHDEDSDGHQDPGEPGLPNVRVVLKDANGNPIAETRTDSHGGYVFPNLPAGNYFIDVDETTLPPGLTQTPLTNPGGDFGNQDQSGKGYPLTLTPGQNNTTADFGYNKDLTPTKDKPGTIGDRVWVDTDGDGVQDPNEPGVTGATLTLTNPGPDGIFGTADDLPPVTTKTDANGNYLFQDIAPGTYKVCVTSSTGASHDVLAASQYTQTGSPDQFGKPATGASTNCTNTPIVLAPGDVFLNADFGYQPTPAAPLGSIGDTIFFDGDADGNGPSLAPVDGGAPVTQGAPGTADPTDYGIPGVTVALVRDTNGDGKYTPGTDPIIATTTTNAQGQYLFSSLPLGNYLVLVNDTAQVLANVKPSFDADGVTTTNVSAAVINAATPNLRTVDFGYTPRNQTPGTGTIGDTIWFDQDNSGGSTQGNEPGIKGVTVELLNSTGIVIATTTTDANGHYYFSGLPLNETYQVHISTSNFAPGGPLAGTTATYDSNGPADGLGAKVTLTPTAPSSLDQDFSYATSGPTGSIGNQVWLDTNADGVYQPTSGETPLAGVTIDLYRDLNGNGLIDANEPRFATTTTASDGTYLFTGLPAGSYVVDVSDQAGVLVGYWHSRGTDGSDNNSQADPYPVALAAGTTNLTADFGYYVQSAALGNWVWRDTNKDGIQNDGETGINGVPVTLIITYPGGTVTQVKTTTSNDPVVGTRGWYSFGNLLLDENYNGIGTDPEPTFAISIATPSGLQPAPVDKGSNDAQDSDPSGVAAQPIKGQTNTLRSNDASPIASYDFGFVQLPPPGSIGNHIWHDEDSDGHYDPGEPGISNVRVVLKDDKGNPIAETRTDSHGNYLFPNLPAGSYCVDVDESTLPAGMIQTPLTNPGSVNGNQDQSGKGYCFTIAPGENNLTANFGYNNNPTTDVKNPPKDAPGTIGDRVWVDTDGDGIQDPNEPGVTGATITLTNPGPDGVFGTSDDLPPVTTKTDANGNYVFDSLPPGSYKVCVTSSTGASNDVLAAGQYTQTGSPDQFSKPATGTSTNCTNVPIVLGPGDVFLNADFGYQPTPAAPLGSIGDTIFFDADADGTGPSLAPVGGGVAVTQGAPGTADPTDYGIPGVTVALVRDTNGDGVYTPGTEPIIATTTTNAQGQYLFPSLPLGSYLVVVNDTSGVLANLTPTFDADGVTTTNVSAAVINAATPNPRTVDFGYTPRGQAPGLGTIGDTIWFDQDKSGGSTQGNEPGIPGVVVELLNDAGMVIATTTTDANGHYYFGGLPLDETYQVHLADSNFVPGGPLEGMAGTYDPEGPFDGLGPKITLTPAAPINLDQEFSYAANGPGGSIGNQVWLDTNADGVYQPTSGETPLAGVTIDLYRDLNGNGLIDANEPRLATTTTASDGTYLFTGLPAGSYIVDVSDQAGVLMGYWHSRGTDGSDNNSQADPYPIKLAAGEQNQTADFGYYVQSAALGNWVWRDTNGDGIQGDSETGINGVPVTLTITYPGGTVSKLVTNTSNDPVAGTPGWYAFGNLLQDEDYNGDGKGSEPTFTISTMDTFNGGGATISNAGGNPLRDSDPHAGVAAQPIKGQNNTLLSNDSSSIASYDFGFVNPTAITLGQFSATWQGGKVKLDWTTSSELNTFGFHLLRSKDGKRESATRVTTELITARGRGQNGAAYSWTDTTVTEGQTYTYWLEETEADGSKHIYGPATFGTVNATATNIRLRLFLPVVTR